MMKLLWSSRSPYARKVMIVAHELGLVEQLELVPIVVSMRNAPEPADNPNPLGKIPTLLLEDGQVLYDSSVICEYFSSLIPGNSMLPPGTGRIATQLRAAQGNGLMDALILLYSERRRKQDGNETEYAIAHRIKISRLVSEFELICGDWKDLPFDHGLAGIYSALSYMDLRFAEDNWRHSRPALTAWYARVSARPSVVSTAYAVDLLPPTSTT